MSQILTYPYGARYSSNLTQYRTEVKDGNNGSIPINDEIHVGDYNQTTGGVSWVGRTEGTDNHANAQSGNYAFEQNSNGRGLYYMIQSSSNKTNYSRCFNICFKFCSFR